MAAYSKRFLEWHSEAARRERERRRQMLRLKVALIAISAWAIGALCGMAIGVWVLP